MSEVLQVFQTSPAALEVKSSSAVTLELGGVAGPSSGGSGGSSKATITNQLLGTLSGTQVAYTWTTLSGVCKRGLMSRLNVTADAGGLFDVQIRDAAAGSGNLWFEAVDCNGAALDVTAPVYIEGTGNSALYLGIRNRATAPRVFYLANLRVEAFA
jgi:hypothetical protein